MSLIVGRVPVFSTHHSRSHCCVRPLNEPCLFSFGTYSDFSASYKAEANPPRQRRRALFPIAAVHLGGMTYNSCCAEYNLIETVCPDKNINISFYGNKSCSHHGCKASEPVPQEPNAKRLVRVSAGDRANKAELFFERMESTEDLG